MRNERRVRLRRSAVVGMVLMLCWSGVVLVGRAPTARAAFWPAGIDFWVKSSTMGPIKSRIFRARNGNTRRVVYALDGLRAQSDLSGWEIETNVAQLLTSQNINVVMPVGGQSSFYTDWLAPSSFGPLTGSAGSSSGSAQTYPNRATWETFLTQELPTALHKRFGFATTRNGVFGLSMGGSAALVLAAYHPRQFSYAGSFSGFLNLSAPGMPGAIRLAMMDAGGYNADDMWGPPWSPLWRRNDPFVFAPLLKAENIRLFVAAGNGLPSGYDVPHSAVDVWQDFVGMNLEALAAANTQAFRIRMDSIGDQNVTYDFPAAGLHNWPYWNDDVVMMVPDMSAHIG